MFIFICINLMFVYKYINKINLIMSKIPKFEKFNEAIVAAGFGPSYTQPYSVATGIPGTGYSMEPIVGTVNTMADHIGEQAYMHETNDNEEHTAEGYLKEAKKYLNEAIDKAYESHCNKK